MKKQTEIKLFVKLLLFLIGGFAISCNPVQKSNKTLPLLKISDNNHYVVDENGNPFFWLGDTGWLLFKKLNREEAEKYLEKRKQQGFNVVQAMLIHDLKNPVNIYGDSSITNKNVASINITEGSDPANEEQYDFWDHVDFIVKLAEEKGIYMALIPIWGSNVRGGHVTSDEAEVYASFLANRYKDQSNIIWLNGGDVRGSDVFDVWNTFGNTINKIDTNHLITFHPFGRTISSDWFHNEKWLDFNMFQSGHRRYDQDDTERGYAQDSWRYVDESLSKVPAKPTIDGEPSYEYIPQGLHDTIQPKWNSDDARRYAYWSVFAGAFGHTYGHGAVMQFYKPGDNAAYGANVFWENALNTESANQLNYLKELMLSRPYLERIPDSNLVAQNQGEKYDHLVTSRGKNYAFIYTFTGRKININLDKIDGDKIKATWFNPRNGEKQELGIFEDKGVQEFDPPGEKADGNDWVLILDTDRT